MSEQQRSGLTIPSGVTEGKRITLGITVCVCVYGRLIVSVCVSAFFQLLTRDIMRD